MIAFVVELVKGLAALPKIGDQVKEIIRLVAEHFAQQEYLRTVKGIEKATEASKASLTKEEKLEALKAWHRALHG